MIATNILALKSPGKREKAGHPVISFSYSAPARRQPYTTTSFYNPKERNLAIIADAELGTPQAAFNLATGKQIYPSNKQVRIYLDPSMQKGRLINPVLYAAYAHVPESLWKEHSVKKARRVVFENVGTYMDDKNTAFWYREDRYRTRYPYHPLKRHRILIVGSPRKPRPIAAYDMKTGKKVFPKPKGFRLKDEPLTARELVDWMHKRVHQRKHQPTMAEVRDVLSRYYRSIFSKTHIHSDEFKQLLITAEQTYVGRPACVWNTIYSFLEHLRTQELSPEAIAREFKLELNGVQNGYGIKSGNHTSFALALPFAFTVPLPAWSLVLVGIGIGVVWLAVKFLPRLFDLFLPQVHQEYQTEDGYAVYKIESGKNSHICVGELGANILDLVLDGKRLLWHKGFDKATGRITQVMGEGGIPLPGGAHFMFPWTSRIHNSIAQFEGETIDLRDPDLKLVRRTPDAKAGPNVLHGMTDKVRWYFEGAGRGWFGWSPNPGSLRHSPQVVNRASRRENAPLRVYPDSI